MIDEVQCKSCDNCQELLHNASVHCLSYKKAVDEGLIKRYIEGQTRDGQGYIWIAIPTAPCRRYTNPKPPVPEDKLIHSPFNWQQYKEVNRGSVS